MNQLRGGGLGPSYPICPTDLVTKYKETCEGTCKDDATCPAHNTCNGAQTCGQESCAFLCSIRTCGGQY